MRLKIETFMKRNASTILTVVGITGVVLTAVMSARDTLKAKKRINYERGYQDKEFDIKEKIKIAVPCYIPTISIGIATIASVVGANIYNQKIQASLISAYALLNNTYREYKNSVVDVYGDEGSAKIKRNLLVKRYKETEVKEASEGKIMFFDFQNLMFFESTMEEVEYAEQTINDTFKEHGVASLYDFYEMLGVDPSLGDHLGWTEFDGRACGYSEIRFEHEFLPNDDGQVCCAIVMTPPSVL